MSARRLAPRHLPCRTATLITTALSAALLCACQPERRADELVVLLDAPPRTVDPRLAVDSPSARLSRLIFEGLTEVDDRGEVTLVLAESVTADADRDALGRPLSYRVRLRPGLRFHDGRPLTGRDVAYTYASVMDPAFGTPISGAFRRRFARVVVDANDPLVVHFQLRRPLATFMTDIVLGIAPADLGQAPQQRFVGLPVGSGPWRLVAPWDPLRVRIERFDGHRNYRPPAPGEPRRLLIRAISDEGARVLSVLGGGADVAMGGLSPAVLNAAGDNTRAHVVSSPGIAWAYAGFNLRHPKLADLRVRQALAMALDRQHIVDSLLAGRARLSSGMFPPEHWAHAELPPIPFDPAAAERLLDDAGLPRDPATGVRLRLELKVSTSRLRRAVARAVAHALAKVGVDVAVRAFELGTFLDDVRAGRFELFLLLLPEPLEPDFLAWMFHSQNAPGKVGDPQAASPYARLERRALPPGLFSAAVINDPECGPWSHRAAAEGLGAFVLAALGLDAGFGSANRTAYHDPLVDCLLELGRSRLDRPGRVAAYRRAQIIVRRDLPVIPLWFEDQSALVRTGIHLPDLAADGRYHVLARARRLIAAPPGTGSSRKPP